MTYELSNHVREEMERRGIPLVIVEGIMNAFGQKVPEHDNVVCYQSKAEFGGKPYVVRVMVNEAKSPLKVVTVYRTSKIAKYWRDS